MNASRFADCLKSKGKKTRDFDSFVRHNTMHKVTCENEHFWAVRLVNINLGVFRLKTWEKQHLDRPAIPKALWVQKANDSQLIH